MSNELDQPADQGRPRTFQIRITGRLDPRWEEWFDGLTITLDDGDTLITGPVIDQAALHGLLRRVRDLGLPLVSVTPVEGVPEAAPPLILSPRPHVRRSAPSRTSHIERGPGKDRDL
jgi:hypothetical protein